MLETYYYSKCYTLHNNYSGTDSEMGWEECCNDQTTALNGNITTNCVTQVSDCITSASLQFSVMTLQFLHINPWLLKFSLFSSVQIMHQRSKLLNQLSSQLPKINLYRRRSYMQHFHFQAIFQPISLHFRMRQRSYCWNTVETTFINSSLRS